MSVYRWNQIFRSFLWSCWITGSAKWHKCVNDLPDNNESNTPAPAVRPCPVAVWVYVSEQGSQAGNRRSTFEAAQSTVHGCHLLLPSVKNPARRVHLPTASWPVHPDNLQSLEEDVCLPAWSFSSKRSEQAPGLTMAGQTQKLICSLTTSLPPLNPLFSNPTFRSNAPFVLLHQWKVPLLSRASLLSPAGVWWKDLVSEDSCTFTHHAHDFPFVLGVSPLPSHSPSLLPAFIFHLHPCLPLPLSNRGALASTKGREPLLTGYTETVHWPPFTRRCSNLNIQTLSSPERHGNLD